LKTEEIERVAKKRYRKFCQDCHREVAMVTVYDDGSLAIIQNGRTLMKNIKAKSLTLSCPAGHKVTLKE
jgi:hypothetical protein